MCFIIVNLGLHISLCDNAIAYTVFKMKCLCFRNNGSAEYKVFDEEFFCGDVFDVSPATHYVSHGR